MKLVFVVIIFFIVIINANNHPRQYAIVFGVFDSENNRVDGSSLEEIWNK
jgi:hypothetical protein